MDRNGSRKIAVRIGRIRGLGRRWWGPFLDCNEEREVLEGDEALVEVHVCLDGGAKVELRSARDAGRLEFTTGVV